MFKGRARAHAPWAAVSGRVAAGAEPPGCLGASGCGVAGPAPRASCSGQRSQWAWECVAPCLLTELAAGLANAGVAHGAKRLLASLHMSRRSTWYFYCSLICEEDKIVNRRSLDGNMLQTGGMPRWCPPHSQALCPQQRRCHAFT